MQQRNYTRVNKTLSPHAYLVDSHFLLDKICVARGVETNNFDALFSPDTPGAHPSVCFPIKSVYLVFVFFLCIRRAAAADTVMFIVLSYTSVSYVADAAIYLYHYCVYVFVYAVYHIYHMWQMKRYTCMVCLLYVPLSPWLYWLCAWWVTVHLTLAFVFLGFLACAPYTNPVRVVLLFVSKCLARWSTDAL